MATFYSDWGTAKSVKDSDSRRCQVHLKVDWSSDETKVYYTVNGYAHSGDNSGYYYCSDYGITVTLYYSLNGNSWISLGSASGTLNYNNNVANITKPVTINRTHSSQTIKFKAEGTGNYINTVNATSGTDTMRALTAYSVTYNGNAINVTNMPANDTKWYNETYTVTSATPKRASTTANGYTVIFNNNYGTTPATSSITVTNTINYSLKPNRWNTNSAGTSAAYTSGATITANNDIILYAQWTSSTVPGSIQSLPTPQSRGSDYTFLNWNTVRTPSTTTPGITYTAGSTFTPTTATTTLYAQWKQNYIPANLTNVSVIRVENNTSTAQIDTGTWGYVTVNWTKGGVNSASLNRNPNKIKWTIQNGSTTVSGTIPPPTIPSNTSSYNFHINGPSPTTSPNNGKLDPDKTWNLSVSIEDTYENTTYTSQKTTLLSSTYYTMDFLKGGKGIAFGKPATITSVFDIGLNTQINNSIATTPVLTVSAITIDNVTPTAVSITGATKINGATNINGTTTITGTTTFSSETVNYKSSNLTNNTAPTTTAYANSKIYFRDSNNSLIGLVEPTFFSSGKQAVRIGAYRPGSTNYSNMLYLHCNTDGSPEVSFSTGGKAAWQTALGITKGTSSNSYGTWNWTKIDNLVIAQWRSLKKTISESASGWAQWGSLWYYGFGSLNFPFTFATAPEVSLTFTDTGWITLMPMFDGISTDSISNIYMWRTNKISVSDFYLCLTVTGRVSS